MFFVLNTGRAGSKTIAKVLSQAPDCECLHEPEPSLIEEAPRYRYGSCDADSIVDVLRRTRVEPAGTRIYGESNNRLALIVPVLERAFPGSRYLWLVRDGRDFVASVHQRGWFGDREYADDAGPWSRWRLQGDLVGDVDPAEWSGWSAFERCCWIWEYTNVLIRRDLGVVVTDDHWLLVRIETLAASVDRICDFLGIGPTSFVVHRANRRTVEESYEGTTNRVSSVSTWHEWSVEQRSVFARHCGRLMDELYPEWRDGDEWRSTPQEVEGRAMVKTGGEHRPGAPDEVASIRADLAELKLQRGDLRALTGLLAAAEHRSERHSEVVVASLEELRKVITLVAEHSQRVEGRTEERAVEASTLRELRDELAMARQRAERAEGRAENLRNSLERTRVELATTVERSRTLQADRDRYQRAIRERNAERDRANALANSTSYRFGHAAVMLVKHPIRTPLQTAKRLWRRLRAPGSQDAPPHTATGRVRAMPSGSQPAALPSPQPLLSDRYPVHAYVALGFGREQLRTLARAVRQRAMVSGRHVPLIVTDSPSFPIIRDTGVAVEYVPDREMWENHENGVTWAELRSSRITHLLSTHQPTRTIVMHAATPIELPQLLDLNPDSP